MGNGDTGEARKRGAARPLLELDDLDDPAVLEAAVAIEERAADTARPDYEPGAFAQHIESAEDRMTQPPSPTYDMLRDSCKTAIAAEVALDEEQILRPSSRKQRVPDRR